MSETIILCENMTERLARIIDPDGWAVHDRRKAQHAYMNFPIGATTLAQAEASADSYIQDSMRKARLCLLALTQPSEEMFEELSNSGVSWRDNNSRDVFVTMIKGALSGRIVGQDEDVRKASGMNHE